MSGMQDRTPNPAGPVSPAEVARVKQKAATLSVVASVVLTLAKFGAAILSGSLALLTDLSVRRHGQSAVIRALARSERAEGSVAAF